MIWLVSFRDFPFEDGTVEGKLKGGTQVRFGTGVINDRFIVACFGHFNIPGDLVVLACPVPEERTVGGSSAAFDAAMLFAIARRKQGRFGEADRKGSLIRAKGPFEFSQELPSGKTHRFYRARIIRGDISVLPRVGDHVEKIP